MTQQDGALEKEARNLKPTVDTVRRWLREGTIQGRKLGRVWRIPKSEEDV